MSKQRTFTGHSGQMAVLAELLFRQCNVAVPEVDWGVDAFAFMNERADVTRIQIKTAQGERYKSEEGYSVQFDIPIRQLAEDDTPRLYYILAARFEGQFTDFLIVSRYRLERYWRGGTRFGTVNSASGNLVLTVQFRPSSVRCGEVDLIPHLNAWDRLPPFQPVPARELTAPGEAEVGTDSAGI